MRREVTGVVIHGPLCGMWYITPVFSDGTKGGVTGFESRTRLERHLESAYNNPFITWVDHRGRRPRTTKE